MAETSEKRNLIIEAHLAKERYILERAVGYATRRCESPIEELMGAALYLAVIHELAAIDLVDAMNWQQVQQAMRARQAPFEDCGYGLFSQVEIAPYRADFVLGYRFEDCEVLAVIECDGHDFHEKTKEQVRRDKSRDRFLSASGAVVLRFSGSEIWADATGCAKQAVETVSKLAWQGFERRLEAQNGK